MSLISEISRWCVSALTGFIAINIGEPGTADELSHIGARFPLMPVDRIVLFGYNPREINAPEQDLLARRRLLHYPLSDVRERTTQAAIEAVKYLEGRAKRFIVHFDVDVIDFTDLFICFFNRPQRRRGNCLRR
jgi:arginase